MSMIIGATAPIRLRRVPIGGGGGGDVLDTGSGDPRWADVLMLVDFTGQNGLTSVTDVKNGDVYTLRGPASIASDQLITGSGAYADTPDSAYHDPGTSPDTIEFLGIRFYSLTGGYQCIVSNFDGTHVCFTVQLSGTILHYNTAGGADYPFDIGAYCSTGVDYHIAFTRTAAGVLNLWIDGQKHTTEYTGVSANITGSVNSFTFGNLPSTTGYNQPFEGRVKAFRMTDGTARYTSTFTPPTAFSHAGISTGDSRWADVKMLIDFTGLDGQTTFTDVKNGEVYTLHGSATISGGQFVGPDGYSWAETPDSANHDIGEAPDTVEFKDVQFDDLIDGGYFHTLLSNMDGLTPTLGFGYNGGTIYFQYKDGNRWEFPFTPVLHQKYDLAWSREETTHIVRFFVDGVLQATTYSSPDPIILGSTRKMFIGALNYGDNPYSCLIGRIGAIRVTDGAARYTASFTPPTSFPHSA